MKDKKKTTKRRKIEPRGECFFCKEKATPDFLKSEVLSRFTSERGKIQPRAKSELCGKHQRKLTEEVKRARYMALLPFVVRPE